MVWFLIGARDFSLLQSFNISSRAHPASCSEHTVSSFPVGKMFGAGICDHSHPSSAEVKNGWNYSPTPTYALIVSRGTSSPYLSN
jgi:hypothetical protein